MAEPQHFRWVASITYRTDNGPIDVDYCFEELGGLHALVERGPDWNALEQIVVRLNPHRATYPDDPVERSKER
jgi:hypothetical protein